MFSHMFLLIQLLLLVFLRNRYLLISQRQYIVHAPPCFWNRTLGFLKARRSWEPGSSITTDEFSLFRLLRKVSAVNVRWTEHNSYLSFSQKSSSSHFLALAKLCSTARVWNHQRICKLVNRVDCRLSSDSFLALLSKVIVRAFLATNALQWDLQCTHAIYGICHLSDDSFFALCSSNSADVPCYKYFAVGALLCIKQFFYGTAFAALRSPFLVLPLHMASSQTKSCRSRYFNQDGSLLNPDTQEPKKRNSWLRTHGTLPLLEPPSCLPWSVSFLFLTFSRSLPVAIDQPWRTQRLPWLSHTSTQPSCSHPNDHAS